MHRILAAIMLIGVSAPSAAGEHVMAKAAPANTPEKDCIKRQDVRERFVRNDRVIDFKMKNGEVYRNTLPSSCPNLGFEKSFTAANSYQTVKLDRICSGGLITVTSPGISPGARCSLGKFLYVP